MTLIHWDPMIMWRYIVIMTYEQIKKEFIATESTREFSTATSFINSILIFSHDLTIYYILGEMKRKEYHLKNHCL